MIVKGNFVFTDKNLQDIDIVCGASNGRESDSAPVATNHHHHHFQLRKYHSPHKLLSWNRSWFLCKYLESLYQMLP